MEGDDADAIQKSMDELAQASHKLAEQLYESSSSRQTGVINRDAVFCVVVRYPLFTAEISRLDT